MLAKLFLASLRANLGRTLLALAGIALGVALGLAVHVINQSAIGEMQQAARTLSGDADLSIRAGRANAGGFDEKLLEMVAADERVQMASPVIEADAIYSDDASNTGTGGAILRFQANAQLNLSAWIFSARHFYNQDLRAKCIPMTTDLRCCAATMFC